MKHTITYEVIVGNIGSVYYGPRFSEAKESFTTYVSRSKEDSGRAAGEAVTLLRDGDIVEEYAGTLTTEW